MPFESEAQRRWMHAAEARGEVPKGTASRWEHHTKNKKDLPEYASQKRSAIYAVIKRALNEHDTYSGPPAFAPEEPAPVVTTEAAKYLTERSDENRTDNRDAPSALPMLGAKEAGVRFVGLGRAAALATYGLAHTGNTKLALTRRSDNQSDDDGYYARPPVWSVPTTVLGAAGLAPAVGALTAGHLGVKQINKNVPAINQDTLTRSRGFAALGDKPITSSPKFMADYVNQGSELVKAPALTGGTTGPMSVGDVISKVRSGPVGNLLQAAGVNKQYDEASKKHYAEFAKGPRAALSQVAEEVTPGLQQNFLSDVLGTRYHAAQESIRNGKIHPSLFRKNLATRFGALFSSPEEGAAYAQKLEAQLAQSGGKDYMAHLAGVAEGRDVGHMQDEMLRKSLGEKTLQRPGSAGELMQRRVHKNLGSRGAAIAPESAQVANTLKNDLVGQYMALRGAPTYHAATKDYGRLINTADKYNRARTGAMNAARKMRAYGGVGTLGALGLTALGTYGLTHRPTPQQNTDAQGG